VKFIPGIFVFDISVN